MNKKYEKTNKDYNATYLKALNFIDQFVFNGNVSLISTLPRKEIDGYFYILHRDNYFQTTPIPEGTFDINCPCPYSIIAEVYAKYFCYAPWIEKEFNESPDYTYAKDFVDDSGTDLDIDADGSEHTLENLTIEEICHSKNRQDIERIIKVLSSDYPIGQLYGFKKMSLKEKKEINFAKQKLVLDYKQGKIYFHDERPIRTIAMFLCAYMVKLGWLREEPTITRTCEVLNAVIYFGSDHGGMDRAQFSNILTAIKSNTTSDYLQKNPKHAPYFKFMDRLFMKN